MFISNTLRLGRWMTSCLLATFLSALVSTAVVAQENAQSTAQAALEAKVESLMDELELFSKTEKTPTGGKQYVVMFEMDGETTKILLSIRSIGTHRDQPMFALYGWSTVVGGESPQPPAVIKLVASENDNITMGSFSMSGDFKNVFCNSSLVLEETTTASALFMSLGHLHVNRLELAKKIGALSSSE